MPKSENVMTCRIEITYPLDLLNGMNTTIGDLRRSIDAASPRPIISLNTYDRSHVIADDATGRTYCRQQVVITAPVFTSGMTKKKALEKAVSEMDRTLNEISKNSIFHISGKALPATAAPARQFRKLVDGLRFDVIKKDKRGIPLEKLTWFAEKSKAKNAKKAIIRAIETNPNSERFETVESVVKIPAGFFNGELVIPAKKIGNPALTNSFPFIAIKERNQGPTIWDKSYYSSDEFQKKFLEVEKEQKKVNETSKLAAELWKSMDALRKQLSDVNSKIEHGLDNASKDNKDLAKEFDLLKQACSQLEDANKEIRKELDHLPAETGRMTGELLDAVRKVNERISTLMDTQSPALQPVNKKEVEENRKDGPVSKVVVEKKQNAGWTNFTEMPSMEFPAETMGNHGEHKKKDQGSAGGHER